MNNESNAPQEPNGAADHAPVVLKYVGKDGAFVWGLPPRDLTAGDLDMARATAEAIAGAYPHIYAPIDGAPQGG